MAPKSHGSFRQKSGRIGRHAGQQIGGMKQARRVSKMILGVEKKLLWPAFLIGVLALFLSTPTAQAQKTVKDLPPPPPLWKPKPTPTPKPVEPEKIEEVIRTNSNLVLV